jgi:hypothetical protein
MPAQKYKLPKLQVVHRAYGECVLIERRESDSGDVMQVRFADKTERTLLADAKYWITPLPELKATRVKPSDEPDDEPEVERDSDDEPELAVAKSNRSDELEPELVDELAG